VSVDLLDEEDAGPSRLYRTLRALGRMLGAVALPDRFLPTEVQARRFGLALFVCMLCAGAFAVAVGVQLDPRREMLTQPQMGPVEGGGDDAPQSDRDFTDAVAKRRAVLQVTLGLGAVLGTPAQIFLLAFGLYLLGRYVGGKPTLGNMMAVASHGSLALGVRNLLGAGGALAARSLGPSEIPGLLGQGPGQALHGLVSGPAARLLAGVDGFTLYALVLVILGFRHGAHTSRLKAAIAVLVVFSLYLVLTGLVFQGGGGPPGPPRGAR